MTTTMTSTGIWYPDGTIETTNNSASRAIFGFGMTTSAVVNMTNLVSNFGNVSTDTTSVGTARRSLAAAVYGGDKAIFAYGCTNPPPYVAPANTFVNMSNLVSNLGVVASDSTGVGTLRFSLGAAGYGGDKSIFAYGFISQFGGDWTAVKNLVSNIGVVAADVTGVGSPRQTIAAGYGVDKSIFAYGYGGRYVSVKNLVSNLGIVAADVAGVGTARGDLAAASYGYDKAIFVWGQNGALPYQTVTNLVDNLGVVVANTLGVVGVTARGGAAGAGYGGDRAIFGYGESSVSQLNTTNKISSIGVVATDTTGVGTARRFLAGSSYSS